MKYFKHKLSEKSHWLFRSVEYTVHNDIQSSSQSNLDSKQWWLNSFTNKSSPEFSGRRSQKQMCNVDSWSADRTSVKVSHHYLNRTRKSLKFVLSRWKSVFQEIARISKFAIRKCSPFCVIVLHYFDFKICINQLTKADEILLYHISKPITK